MELRVGVGIHGDLKERLENVFQELLEIFNDALRLVDIVKSRNLQCQKREEICTI